MLIENKKTDLVRWKELREQVSQMGGPVKKHQHIYRYFHGLWCNIGVSTDWELSEASLLAQFPELEEATTDELKITSLVLLGMWYGMSPHTQDDELTEEQLTAKRRDEVEQLLYQKKVRENAALSKGDDDLVPLSQVGIYKASIPLIQTGGMLFIGVLTSVCSPNGQDFLDLTPVQDFKDAAERHSLETGVDVTTDAWNSYQECLKNPLLVSLEKLSPEEFHDLVEQV